MSAEIRKQIQQLTKIKLRQEDFIGQGGYALVYRYWMNNIPIAVKCFENQQDALQEMNILNGIQSLVSNCPGILEFYGMKKIQIEMLNNTFEKYVIFLQACEIDLQKKMLMKQKIPPAKVFDISSQLSLSLLCIHMNNCFHGNIKPSNILVNQNNQEYACYFTDYGQGNFVGNYISTNFDMLSLKGTLFYYSPELYKIHNNRETLGNYDPLATDVYALGITILELLISKEQLFKLIAERGNQQQYDKEIINIKQQLLKIVEFQNNPDNELLNILLKMINFDQLQRPSALEICFTLISQKQFCINALTFNNMQALITQLIQSLYWAKKKKKELLEELENQKAIIEILSAQQSQQYEENKNQQLPEIPAIPKSIEIQGFNSNVINNVNCIKAILALFNNANISLNKIHSQLHIKKFDPQQFHNDCDEKGPTLVIIHSQEEPDSFFGGMAASSWNQQLKMIADPPEEYSWLFKIEFTDNKMSLHQWKCIDKINAIAGDNQGFQFGCRGSSCCYYLGLGYDYYELYSKLPTKNNNYEKIELTKNINLQKLTQTIQIDCPVKVQGKIMNEEYQSFILNSLEVYSIKK